MPTPRFDIERIGYETRRAIERPLQLDRATLRGARAVGIVCAALFFLPVILSLAFPSAFFYPPYHRVYERMLGALLLAFGLGLLLALRDPSRNAGVFAVVGLATGFLSAANVYALLVRRPCRDVHAAAPAASDRGAHRCRGRRAPPVRAPSL